MASQIFGKNILLVERTGSTNTYALNLLSNSKPLPEGTVIMAENQSSGRGQQGKFWESEPGKNLTISFILYPSFIDISRQFYLSKIISLAITDLLSDLVPDPKRLKIKWPNDIYYHKDKLGGILIENVLMGSSLKTSVVGIGLNVNQEEFSAGVPNPVSLKNITGESYPLNDLLRNLSEKIEIRYKQLQAFKFALIDEQYLAGLFRLEEYASYRTSKGVVQGTITGVSSNGKIQLLLNQSAEEFDLNEIQFVI